MEKQYCRRCEKMVVWKTPPSVTMKSGKVFYLGCPGQNDIHFCERTDISLHEATGCKCLEDK